MASASAFSLFGHHSGSKGTRITTAVSLRMWCVSTASFGRHRRKVVLMGDSVLDNFFWPPSCRKPLPEMQKAATLSGSPNCKRPRFLKTVGKPIAPDILTCPKTGRHAPLDPLSFWPKAADAHAPFACPAAGACWRSRATPRRLSAAGLRRDTGTQMEGRSLEAFRDVGSRNQYSWVIQAPKNISL